MTPAPITPTRSVPSLFAVAGEAGSTKLMLDNLKIRLFATHETSRRRVRIMRPRIAGTAELPR
jgi:hypothetical protein